jgi:hypothetical protein
LHDGNGLSDAEPLVHPGVPRGTTSGKFFAGVPYDILAIGKLRPFFSKKETHLHIITDQSPTIGNHELYDLTIAQSMHDNFAPM